MATKKKTEAKPVAQETDEAGRQIPIDRQKRLTLLNWLKNGSIDNKEYCELLKGQEKQTDEELEAEIDRLTILAGYEPCRRCQSLGLCELQDSKDK